MTSATTPTTTTNGAPRRCACCGHAIAGARCERCSGVAVALDDARTPLRGGRRFPLADFLAGVLTPVRAAAQALHHRAFVGRLALPIAANVVAFSTFAAALWLLALPRFAAWFAQRWLLLDGFRAAHRDDGPIALLLATGCFLWPVWFDVVAGAACEGLAVAAEAAIGGPRMAGAGRPGLRATTARLRWHARLLALQLCALPLLWLLALLPVAGLALALLPGAAVAALVFGEGPAQRRGLPRAVLVADLRRNWARALGYGVGCQLALLVPIFDVLLLAPAAAVGAAVLHFQFDKDTARSAGGREVAELH